MNRVLVVFSDGLLSELDSARGLVSRSAWIRQAVEDKLMKEAVAPLVPAHWSEGRLTDEEWQALNRQQASEGLPAGLLSEEGNRLTPQRIWKGTAAEWAAFEEGAGFETPEEPKPKARRKRKGEVGNPSVSLVDALAASVEATAPIPCVCGGRIYQIGSRKGQCSNCSKPKPLKEPT